MTEIPAFVVVDGAQKLLRLAYLMVRNADHHIDDPMVVVDELLATIAGVSTELADAIGAECDDLMSMDTDGTVISQLFKASKRAAYRMSRISESNGIYRRVVTVRVEDQV